VAEWYSIEVLDGATSAAGWADAHGDALVESAITQGATDFMWHRHGWGVVFELRFESDEAWERYRDLVGVRAALDAVPDPLTGLIVYRGRGGSAGTAEPRRPRPLVGAGSAALPIPWDLGVDDIVGLSSLAGPSATRSALAGPAN
jgi:hypothetical protein